MKKINFTTTALSIALLVITTPAVFAQNKTKKVKSHPQSAIVSSNIQLGKAAVEVFFNAPTIDALTIAAGKIFSPNYIQHNPIVPPGRDGLIGFVGLFRQSYPDGKATLLDVIATEEKVIARWNFKGTLTGQPIMGAPANGQKVDFDVIDIWTVKDGLLYEHWDLVDWISLLSQLGAKEIPETFKNVATQKIQGSH